MLLKTVDSHNARQISEFSTTKLVGLALSVLTIVSPLGAFAQSTNSDKLPAAPQSVLPDRQAASIKESMSAVSPASGPAASDDKSGAGKSVAQNADQSVKTTNAPSPTTADGKSPEVRTTGGGDSVSGGKAAISADQKVNGANSEQEGRSMAAPVQTTSPVKVKQGQELSIGTDTEDLVPTDDVTLARKQVTAYPDSPEASFILAVALTRTSHVEEALQEVKRAKKLAESKGGPTYFDKMIATYEDMLKSFPKENRVRYGLAWAYYMKAYLLAQQSQKIQKWNAAQAAIQAAAKSGTPAPTASPAPKSTNIWDLASVAASGVSTSDPAKRPHIEGALEKAEPTLRPQIKKYYEAALKKLDELLAQKPDDLWAKVYRAFLKAEYTGNLDEAMVTWQQCRDQYPNNPAPYFFLGEGYLKQGNLKECFNNVSKAIALRSIGN